MNDFDDRIRDGLADAPVGHPATPPFADVERRARRVTRRRRAMAGGTLLGTVAVVVGIVAMQQPDDEDGQTVVVTQPESTTTTTEPARPSTTTSTTVPEETTTTTTSTVPSTLPAEIVTFDPSTQQLVVVRTDTGEIVEVLDTMSEGEQLTSLDVSADGAILYVTSSDVLDGIVHRVQRGGAPQTGPPGMGVAAGPGGSIVVADETRLVVYDDFSASSGRTVFDGDGGARGFRRPFWPAWSPDGRWITAQVADGVLVDDTTLEPGDHTISPGGRDRVWFPVTFDAAGDLVVFEHTSCSVLGDQTIDPECVEEPPQLHVVDPDHATTLGSIDLGTDELAADLDVDPTDGCLLVTLSTYRSHEQRVRWYCDGRSGIVPGPYTSYAVWAPPATGG